MRLLSSVLFPAGLGVGALFPLLTVAAQKLRTHAAHGHGHGQPGDVSVCRRRGGGLGVGNAVCQRHGHLVQVGHGCARHARPGDEHRAVDSGSRIGKGCAGKPRIAVAAGAQGRC